jgi:hypothetical protein
MSQPSNRTQNIPQLAKNIQVTTDYILQKDTEHLEARAKLSNIEDRLYAIELLLGLNTLELKTDKLSVISFLNKCEDAILLDQTKELTPTELLDWSKELSCITEEYLKLVAHYTREVEPWLSYMTLVTELLRNVPIDKFTHDKKLEAAHTLLKAVQDKLRQVVYFYIRDIYGKDTATNSCKNTFVSPKSSQILTTLSLLFPD